VTLALAVETASPQMISYKRSKKRTGVASSGSSDDWALEDLDLPFSRVRVSAGNLTVNNHHPS
jgi:hypothetical protein